MRLPLYCSSLYDAFHWILTPNVESALYEQYFEQARHPSSHETLLKAAADAGIDEKEAAAFFDSIDPEGYDEGTREAKSLIQQQKGDGIDSVPYVVVEGKRRDFTLVGAKEVEAYVKVLEQVKGEST